MRSLPPFSDEDGQSLVFVIAMMLAFVVLAGVVVAVGSWIQVQRKVQSVADAAALAGVQELHAGYPQYASNAASVASQYAALNSPSGLIRLDRVDATGGDSSTIEVTASAPLANFIPLGLDLAGKRATASATATVQPPQSLSNQLLGGPPKPYLVPLVVSQRIMEDCLASNCFGNPQTLPFGALGVICPASQGGCPVRGSGRGKGSGRRAAARKVAGWITGGLPGGETVDASGDTECTAPDSVVASNEVRDALDTVADEGMTLIFPVFSGSDNGCLPYGSYHLSGFAAFVVDRGGVSWDNGNCNSDSCELRGHFTTYTTPGPLSLSGSDAPDYGVREIGLTG